MTDREKQLTRALLAIDGLCLTTDLDTEPLASIYRIAHGTHGLCDAHDPCLENGPAVLAQVIAELKVTNVCDVEKHLAEMVMP